MDASDMIFSDENNKITSGGFSVNSIMLKMGLSPLVTLNKLNGQSGGANVSDMFDGIVIPNWAFTHNMTAVAKSIYNPETATATATDVDDEVVQDNIYDNLLDLVRHYDKKHAKKQTKKIKLKKSSKNTRKNI